MDLALPCSAGKPSFSRQFLTLGLVVFSLAVIVTGVWIGRQIEHGAINRAASIAAVYTDSILHAQLREMPSAGTLRDDVVAALDDIFVAGPLAKKVVRFKLWLPDGTIMYSSDASQAGQRFPVSGLLASAFAGEVASRLTDLEQADNATERSRWPRLLEVYVPFRLVPEGPVTAVAEFYHATGKLEQEINAARLRGWLVTGLAAVVIGVLLRALFKRADATIGDQAQDLQRQLARLRVALGENARIHAELARAGERTTALNEQLLHRIAADLHDGPAQKLAYALLRFDEACCADADDGVGAQARMVQAALRDALDDIRNIASGVGLPQVEALSLDETVRRAVRDMERQYGAPAHLQIAGALGDASLAVKITAYRFIQEALGNARSHAPGVIPLVEAVRDAGEVVIVVRDDGPGFSPALAAQSGRLGLDFLRERIRLIGGHFTLYSSPGDGTSVRAVLPLESMPS